jgi:hypothetical protein
MRKVELFKTHIEGFMEFRTIHYHEAIEDRDRILKYFE